MKINSYKKFVAVWALVFIIMYYIIVPVIYSNESVRRYSIYSDDESGLSSMKASIENYKDPYVLKNIYTVHNIIATPDIIAGSDPKSNLLVSVGPGRAYTDSEVNGMLSFVKRGGNIIIGDNSENSIRMADKLSLSLFQERLWDEHYYGSNISWVYTKASLNNVTYRIVMPHPTAIINNNPSSVTLATSSNDSYIDVNGNGDIEAMDAIGPFNLVVVASYGSGKVVFVSDPGIFSNEVINVADNEKFLINLIYYLMPDGGNIIFDESTHVSDKYLVNVYKSIGMVAEIAVGENGYNMRTMFLGIAFFAVIYISTRIRTIATWVHRFNIHNYIGIKSIPEDMFQEKLVDITKSKIAQISLLSEDETKNLSIEKLLSLISDDTIKDFIANPHKKMNIEDMINIIEKLKEMKR